MPAAVRKLILSDPRPSISSPADDVNLQMVQLPDQDQKVGVRVTGHIVKICTGTWYLLDGLPEVLLRTLSIIPVGTGCPVWIYEEALRTFGGTEVQEGGRIEFGATIQQDDQDDLPYLLRFDNGYNGPGYFREADLAPNPDKPGRPTVDDKVMLTANVISMDVGKSFHFAREETTAGWWLRRGDIHGIPRDGGLSFGHLEEGSMAEVFLHDVVQATEFNLSGGRVYCDSGSHSFRLCHRNRSAISLALEAAAYLDLSAAAALRSLEGDVERLSPASRGKSGHCGVFAALQDALTSEPGVDSDKPDGSLGATVLRAPGHADRVIFRKSTTGAHLPGLAAAGVVITAGAPQSKLKVLRTSAVVGLSTSSQAEAREPGNTVTLDMTDVEFPKVLEGEQETHIDFIVGAKVTVTSPSRNKRRCTIVEIEGDRVKIHYRRLRCRPRRMVAKRL